MRSGTSQQAEAAVTSRPAGLSWCRFYGLRPCARANPMLAVAGNALWLLGGIVEVRSAQWHFSSSWSGGHE